MRYKNTFIRIEHDLFNHLEASVKEHNKHYDEADSNKISMDMAVFFLNYIRLKALQYKDRLVHGYVRLHSEFLNDYLKDDLKKYRDFLINKGYIKTIPYNTDDGKSIGYKVLSFNMTTKNSKREYISYEFLSRTYEGFLNKQMEKIESVERRKKSADRRTRHLTKWLNENDIQIDWERAFKWIDENKNLNDEKKFFYSYAVERIRFGLWQYSRSGKDDRLHSNLVNLPSKLRQFVVVKGHDLVSLDIKSSQPYILAGIFNLLITDWDKLMGLSYLLKSKQVKQSFAYSIMNLKILETPIITDFKAYINLVCNSDIYTYVADNLDEGFVKSITFKSKYGEFRDTVYNPATNKSEIKDFEDLRVYCKTLTLEYMYCSTENNKERIKQIKKAYPIAVNQFINDFKYCKELEVPKHKRTKRQREKIKNTKKLFPLFLQQLEAGIMLDTITKEISKIYPDMFMVTIHDSIVVPKDYVLKIKPYFEKRLFEIFGIEANIKTELW